MNRYALATLACCIPVWTAQAVVIDFETEDDLTTPLIAGQIVDTAYDAADPEFGNLFTLSKQARTGGEIGLTIFDSDQTPAQLASQGIDDDDLLVGLGNILIMQNGNRTYKLMNDEYGAYYARPDDSAAMNPIAWVFDFTAPVYLQAIDLIDIDSKVNATLVLTDVEGLTATYFVPEDWTGDISETPGIDGYETLYFGMPQMVPRPTLEAANALVADTDTYGDMSDVEITTDKGFDLTQVTKLSIQFAGTSPSAGIDNLVFNEVPEPGTICLLLATGSMVMLRRRTA